MTINHTNACETEECLWHGRSYIIRSVIHTKESDGIADPLEKMAMQTYSDHYDSGISKELILIDTYFVIYCDAIR